MGPVEPQRTDPRLGQIPDDAAPAPVGIEHAGEQPLLCGTGGAVEEVELGLRRQLVEHVDEQDRVSLGQGRRAQIGSREPGLEAGSRARRFGQGSLIPVEPGQGSGGARLEQNQAELAAAAAEIEEAAERLSSPNADQGRGHRVARELPAHIAPGETRARRVTDRHAIANGGKGSAILHHHPRSPAAAHAGATDAGELMTMIAGAGRFDYPMRRKAATPNPARLNQADPEPRMRPDFGSLPTRYTFTVDVEDHLPEALGSRRFEAMTMRLLDLLDEHGGSGTFFIVGEIVERAPGLVHTIATRGHEVASHGHRHVPLDRLSAVDLGTALATTKRRLEDAVGQAVLGFRAPRFSLRAATGWAVEQVERAGFTYSSSVLPARLPGVGLAHAPAGPFRWHNSSLLEIPCPVGTAGPFRAPCLGGLYLRYLPRWRLRQLLRTLPTEAVWTYCHPYDIDLEEPFRRLRECGTLVSFLLWWQRSRFVARLAELMAGRSSISFRHRLPELERLASSRPAFSLTAAPQPLGGPCSPPAKSDILSPIRGGTR